MASEWERMSEAERGFVLTFECVRRWEEAVDNNDDGGDRDRTEHHRGVPAKTAP